MRLTASTFLCAAVLAGFAVRPQEQPPATPAPPSPPAATPPQERPRGERGGRDHHDEDDTPLMQQMERIEHAMHFLRRSLKDAAQDEKSLEQVVVAQQACLAAKLLVPKMAASVKEADRAAFQKDYRKGVNALLVEWVRLETALLDGDRGAAQESWKKLDQMEEDGHNEFTDGG